MQADGASCSTYMIGQVGNNAVKRTITATGGKDGQACRQSFTDYVSPDGKTGIRVPRGSTSHPPGYDDARDTDSCSATSYEISVQDGSSNKIEIAATSKGISVLPSCDLLDQALPSKTCPSGANGKAILESSDCPSGFYSSECGGDGLPDGAGGGTGEKNYIFSWKIPFSLNCLAYGDAGEPGEYKTTSVSDIKGKIFITLGRGGKWANNYAQGNQAPNGTPTIIKIGENITNSKKILEAAGGKGGVLNQKTDNFNMCFATKNIDGSSTISLEKECKRDTNGTQESTYCCLGGKGTATTQDILSTAPRYSKFDKIASHSGGSHIIGIGLGKGAEGIGSGTWQEELPGTRVATNITYDGSGEKEISNTKFTSPLPASTKVINQIMKPAEINARGGGGAVIIMW